MTIYEAREKKIPARDILSYGMTDEEKVVYIFEENKEEIRLRFPELYYALLGVANKYKDGGVNYEE